MAQVVCSRDVKIAGLLGSAAAASMDAKSSAVAEQQVGLGGTTKWKLASLVCCPLACLASAFAATSNHAPRLNIYDFCHPVCNAMSVTCAICIH